MGSTELDALVSDWSAYYTQRPELSDSEDDRNYQDFVARTELLAASSPECLDALHRLYAAGSDDPLREGFRGMLASVLIPTVGGETFDEASFRAHVEVGFSKETMPLRHAVALPVASSLIATDASRSAYERDQLEYSWSWFGGAPLGFGDEAWPRDSAGQPLMHVAQVDLNHASANAGFERTGLPSDGILQIFHDGDSYGELQDLDRGAWSVRFLIDEGGDAHLKEYPRDLASHLRIPPAPIHPDALISARSPLDASDLSDIDSDRYQRLNELFNWSVYMRNLASADSQELAECDPWTDGYVPLQPVSHLAGFPNAEANRDYQEILNRVLPLIGSDRHVLLADLNPLTFAGDNLCYGGRHLEVWMRASDLNAARFDHSWCFIRTDS